MTSFISAFFILTFSVSSSARDVWIHAIGIDTNTGEQAQNRGVIYRSANDFEAACTSSERHPECHLFINNDPQYASGTAVQSVPPTSQLPHLEGPPSSQHLLEVIRSQLEHASSGDTVVISLDDHGAPVRGVSPACVWLSGVDFICENEVAEALQHRPPGVHVVIDVNACFSGAFANLASSEVCVATTSTRLNSGSMLTRSFWESVHERHLRTMADLQEPIFSATGRQHYLGSQLMIEQMCRQTRARLGPHAATSQIDALLSIPLLERVNECRDNDMTPRKISALGVEVLDAVRHSQLLSCESLHLPSPVCEARARLQRASLELAPLLRRFQSLAREETAMVEQTFAQRQLTQRISEQLSAVTNGVQLSTDETREFQDSFNLGIEPHYERFTTEHRAVVQRVWQIEQPIVNQVRTSDRLHRESDELVTQLRAHGLYDDLVTVQSCFFESQPEVSQDPTSVEAQVRQLARESENTFPERQFTEQDYRNARQCEAAVHF